MTERWISDDQITQMFAFQAPVTAEHADLHQLVRSNCRDFALWLNKRVPEGPAKTTAISKVREAMFWANAAVADAADD